MPAGDGAQQAGLAGPVAPDQHHPFAGGDGQVGGVDDRHAVEAHRRGFEADHAASPRRPEHHREERCADAAVTTPMGSSAGATAVRATMSATTRNAAPNNADSGRTTR